MDKVKLMNRVDTKFMFNMNELELVLRDLENDYRIVEIDNKRISTYRNLYFDTESFDLYHHHHNGKLNRYKVRYRNYVESDTGFLEVKFKSNKGRTIKTRIAEDTIPILSNPSTLNFLQETLPFNPLTLKPKIWVNYNRITLVNKKANERITLDLNLEFEDSNKKTTLFDTLVIAEVKQSTRFNSGFIQVMKNKQIHEVSISKYCFGSAITFLNLKNNNFKETIYNINKTIQ
jgi:hypothetical protein